MSIYRFRLNMDVFDVTLLKDTSRNTSLRLTCRAACTPMLTGVFGCVCGGDGTAEPRKRCAKARGEVSDGA